MYEMKGISPSISLARLILTQQLIYKSKIKKHDISLDIFVSDSSEARNLPELEKKHFSYIRIHTLYLYQILVYLCCSKSNNVWRSEPYHRGKKISTLIDDWENIIQYGKNSSKARHLLLTSAIRFIL